jgi:phenylalanyl-tRNA synthetase beta chain
MKISLEWLGEYVDLSGLDPQRIALELTMKTAEVEEIHPVRCHLDQVVVGEVLSARPIAEREGLTWVEVGLGAEKLATVCGAPNVRVGMKAPFAPPGAVLAGGARVEKTMLAGHESAGMLCSAKELGLGDYHEVVMDLPADTPTGKALKDLAPARDFLIEIDNKSVTHRPDLWGHYGFARELAAIFGRELKPLGQVDLKNFDDLPAFPVAVDDFTLCPGYCCLLMEGISPAPSPLMMQWRLHTIGLRAINLLVDLTNYIMYEVGQPTHAFDADCLRAVRVAPLGAAGEFTTLDGQARKMVPEDLMIWNEKEPVALAGVMGGLRSEVTPATTRLLLEAANFQPGSIRRTSVRLGLRTDASQRFEKDLPQAFMPLATARFLHLAAQAGQEPQVKSRFSHVGDLGLTRRTLRIPLDYVPRYMGQELSQQETSRILGAIGFGCKQEGEELVIEVPVHRSRRDIGVRQDIVEEVARFYGYDNIEARLPAVAITEYGFNDLLRGEHKLRRLLAQGRGFAEVHAYSWHDDRWLAKIGWEPGESLTLANPIAPYKARLRQTLMPNLLEMVPQNYAQRDEIKLFEVGRVYAPEGGGSRETTRLGAVAFRAGGQEDLEPLFLQMKGLLADAARVLGCGPLDLKVGASDASAWARAGAHLEIWQGGVRRGELGYLTGPILDAFKRNAQVVWLELELEELPLLAYPAVEVGLPSAFPGSWLDFSILWPSAKGYASLEGLLGEFADELVQDRRFVIAYAGRGLDKGVKSFTFRYWIGLADRTLTKEDIDGFKERFLGFLAGKGLQIR